MLVTVNGLAASPLAYMEVDSINITWIALYYVILATAVATSYKRKTSLIFKVPAQIKSGASQSAAFLWRLPMKWVVPPLAMVALLVTIVAATMPDDDIHVSFLNVGQGDAILVRQGNQQVLIDGGPSLQAINLELGRQMPFWDRTIELVVLTHPDQDHLAGLIEVLRRFRVERVLCPDIDDGPPLYGEWQKLIAVKRIEKMPAQAGQRIDFGDVTIRVLHPPSTLLANTGDDVDNNSIVLRLATGRVSFLLSADIRQEAEFYLIANRAELHSTVLKVAHHGSDTSTTPEFLSVIKPQLAIISVGADNKFGHPNQDVVERLEEKLGNESIFRTDQHGTVEFITDGERLWIRMTPELDWQDRDK